MREKPTARELRQQHAYEAAQQRRLERLREHEAELRRMADERWQRRILPLLSNPYPAPTDFDGCTG